MQVAEQGGSFREALLAREEVRAHLSAAQIDGLLQPERYLGAAPDCVDRVLAHSPARPLPEVAS
jgi:adenylosuccinate lyase